jgi:TRAP-type uncharacterized transport system substrate-binding protein
MGHSPYRQWQVFRQTRLIVVASAAEPVSYQVAQAVARLLVSHLPESRAMASRATNSAAIIALLASRQLDVGLLTEADARDAFQGAGRFAEDGPLPLRALAALGQYLFVCRDDFPAPNAWQIARTLTERWREIPPELVGGAPRPEPGSTAPIPAHAAALEYYQGRPQPAASDR